MGDAMLILTRRADEAIVIGDDIEILVMNIKGSQVRIGVKAPRSLTVDRKEVAERKAKEVEGKLHVDPLVTLPAGEYRTLRPGVDYDPDAVCPGCGCFRDRCACDLREAAPDANNGLPEPSSFPPTPAPRGNMSGTAQVNIAKVFAKLKAAEKSVADRKKN
jgi:carbon storage regulator